MIKNAVVGFFVGTGLNIASLFALASERLTSQGLSVTQLDRGFPFSYLENVNNVSDAVAQGSGLNLPAAIANQLFWIVIGVIALLVLRLIYKMFGKLILAVVAVLLAGLYFGFLSLA